MGSHQGPHSAISKRAIRTNLRLINYSIDSGKIDIRKQVNPSDFAKKVIFKGLEPHHFRNCLSKDRMKDDEGLRVPYPGAVTVFLTTLLSNLNYQLDGVDEMDEYIYLCSRHFIRKLESFMYYKTEQPPDISFCIWNSLVVLMTGNEKDFLDGIKTFGSPNEWTAAMVEQLLTKGPDARLTPDVAEYSYTAQHFILDGGIHLIVTCEEDAEGAEIKSMRTSEGVNDKTFSKRAADALLQGIIGGVSQFVFCFLDGNTVSSIHTFTEEEIRVEAKKNYVTHPLDHLGLIIKELQEVLKVAGCRYVNGRTYVFKAEKTPQGARYRWRVKAEALASKKNILPPKQRKELQAALKNCPQDIPPNSIRYLLSRPPLNRKN